MNVPPTLHERLIDEPEAFEFFQAVRLLERYLGETHGTTAVGLGSEPAAESVRFRGASSWRFPGASIRELSEQGGVASMTVELMSFFGAVGVLPEHYTRLVLDRRRAKDDAFERFLDVFLHGLVSLFHRSWERSHIAPGYERSVGGDVDSRANDDPFTGLVRHLIGYGNDAWRDTLAFPDEVLLSYGAAFLPASRSTITLERTLADHLEYPVEIDEWVAQWLEIDVADRSTLPSRANPMGCNAQLGVNFVLGRGVWDSNCRFDVRIGPLSYEAYLTFLPPRKVFREACDFVLAYAGLEYSFAIRPVLDVDEVPACSLGAPTVEGEGDGRPRHTEQRPRLGMTSWLASRSNEEAFDDAGFASMRDRLERDEHPLEKRSW